MHMQNNYIVIMAGGSGTRLWPISRIKHPKQFQKLTNSDLTLLQETFERVRPLAKDVDHILISTTKNYAPLVREQLPDVSPDNIIIEPCGRDTAPAIALVAHTIYKKDPEALITTTPSDHAIKNANSYVSTVQTAFSVIEEHPKKFGLIGITPTEANTELGYIQMGKEISENYKKRVFKAVEFKEKPDAHTAEKYLAHWSYLWNAAYFVFKAETLNEMIKKHTPHITRALIEIDKATDPVEIEKIYCGLPKEPIDTVLLEKLSPEDRFVVPADLEWSDVGNWRTLHDFYSCEHQKTTNVTRGTVINARTENCMIFASGKKTIATLGLEDIVVIDTDDAILIAHRDHAHDVKKIIDKIKDDKLDQLL